ncbi:Nucleolar pre-ribosomal-associated protein 2 [Nakaseomyces bracarensis]|uniref:Nucleolar pre-ribosomal-associated protein 2 n=1 Tax=Nakaseomyces bracarensis TaxID=273131 RepID=A0ABR4NUF0_9SACH
MVRFDTAEQLTKTLRSKTITSNEVVDIIDGLDGKIPYFPKGDIFILDLIVDRWNDQKNNEFRENPKIWALFNKTWVNINDQELLKATFKNLRFGNILKLVLEAYSKDSNTDPQEFLFNLNETFELLVHSITTFQLSYEAASQIIAYVIELCSTIHFDQRVSIISKVINLTNFSSNLLKINSRMSSFFTETLLLPILNYISAFESSPEDINLVKLLKSYVLSFLFNDQVIGLESSKILEKFFSTKAIDNEAAMNFFSIAMNSLSKKNFKQLEPIFLMVIKNRDDVAPQLLNKLASTKKTLSHEFLEVLMKEALEKIKNPDFADNFERNWSLLEYTLKLDIELGIRYSNELLDLLIDNYNDFEEMCLGLWSELVKCHISAREFYIFFSKIKLYFSVKDDELPLLKNQLFSAKISNSLTLLSSTQLKDLISGYMTDIATNNLSKISARLFSILLEGFQYLESSSLSEFKPLLSNIFDFEDYTYPEQWAIKFRIMDLYDDVTDEKSLLSYISDKKLHHILSENHDDIEIYLFFMKVREYVDFSTKPVENGLMDYLNISENKIEQTMFILSNWFTEINTCFDISNISELVKIICEDNKTQNLQQLLKDDDIFEENLVTRCLINNIAVDLKSIENVRILQMVPIQCFDKNKRIELIDAITQLEDIDTEHSKALLHLLHFPTFRTKIESDPTALIRLIKSVDNRNELAEEIFNCIWNHHLNQHNDKTSLAFTETVVQLIDTKLLGQQFDKALFFIAYLIIKNEHNDKFGTLKSTFINEVPMFISKSNDNILVAWILECIYDVLLLTDTLLYKDVIQNCLKEVLDSTSLLNNPDIRSSIFLLYTLLNKDDLHFVFAHYVCFREQGLALAKLERGLRNIVYNVSDTDYEKYNRALMSIIMSVQNHEGEDMSYLFEIMVLLIKFIPKDNAIGCKLVSRLISIFYTNLERFSPSNVNVKEFVEALHELCIKKSWIFDQYTMEMLLPLSVELAYKFVFIVDNKEQSKEDLFVVILKLFTSLLNIHRIKFNQRFHAINSFFCQMIECVLNYTKFNLTAKSVKALSRCIVNYCEPNITSNKSVNKTSSNVNVVRQHLRKHVPILLVKYIELVVNKPSVDNNVRIEMSPAIYAIFDLLSNNEIQIVSTLLDGSGRQYLKSLYGEYKKVGKWIEN